MDAPVPLKDLIGQRVRIHKNLTLDTYNISRYIEGVGWRWARYADRFLLWDAEFKVNQTGRERAVEQGVRNVHAFVYGKLSQVGSIDFPIGGFYYVTYNPFKYDRFVWKSAPVKAVEHASWVIGMPNGVMALDYGRWDGYTR
jgi:hypothetical protein